MTDKVQQVRGPISDLHHFHKNPRKGDVPEIKKSLQEFGQYREIVVNKGTLTGRPMEILIGNHTTIAAGELGWTEIDYRLVDVDATTAAKIVASENRLNQLGTFDDEILTDLLSDLPDLMATGYGEKDLDELMRKTARGANDAIAQFSAITQAPQPTTTAQTPTPPEFSDGGETPTAAPQSQSEGVETIQQAPTQTYPAPDVDNTPYFTVSYTMTAEDRDVVHAAIRKLTAQDDTLNSPKALVEICRRSLA